jgi:hypothetical protein
VPPPIVIQRDQQQQSAQADVGVQLNRPESAHNSPIFNDNEQASSVTSNIVGIQYEAAPVVVVCSFIFTLFQIKFILLLFAGANCYATITFRRRVGGTGDKCIVCI